MPKYLGRGQIAECQRSGAKCLASELVRDGRNPQLLVLPEWADPAHPQERPFLPSPSDGMPRFPVAPQNVSVTAPVLAVEVIGLAATLTWTPAVTVGPALETYELFRSIDDGDFILINTQDVVFGGIDRFTVTEPSIYIDTVAIGHTYHWRLDVSGADRSNSISISSNVATATT